MYHLQKPELQACRVPISVCEYCTLMLLPQANARASSMQRVPASVLEYSILMLLPHARSLKHEAQSVPVPVLDKEQREILCFSAITSPAIISSSPEPLFLAQSTEPCCFASCRTRPRPTSSTCDVPSTSPSCRQPSLRRLVTSS